MLNVLSRLLFAFLALSVALYLQGCDDYVDPVEHQKLKNDLNDVKNELEEHKGTARRAEEGRRKLEQSKKDVEEQLKQEQKSRKDFEQKLLQEQAGRKVIEDKLSREAAEKNNVTKKLSQEARKSQELSRKTKEEEEKRKNAEISREEAEETVQMCFVLVAMAFLLSVMLAHRCLRKGRRLTTWQQAFRFKENTCAMCLDRQPNTVLQPCNHSFCRICLERYMANEQTCPTCRTLVSNSEMVEMA